jgi:tRNA(Ile)-lysidine synthase
VQLGHASGGVEEAARVARYAALHEMGLAAGAATLLLGHHGDDQAETVLLQLLRGAGVAGLAAMPATQCVNGVSRRRPLLGAGRAEVLRYARRHGLTWIDDPSNDDARYTRNVLRLTVIPALRSRFPAYREALSRTARHAAQAQALLAELGENDWRQAARDADGRTLSRRALAALGNARLTNALRTWMAASGMRMPSTAWLAQAIAQIHDAGPGAAPALHHGGRVLRVYRDALGWEPETPGRAGDPPAAHTLRWDGQRTWHLPDWGGTLLFRPVAPGLPGVAEAVLRGRALTVRARRGADRMRAHAHGPRRTLKNLFQEHGVPVWRRAVPVLAHADAVLFVPGIGINHAFVEAADNDAAVRWEMDWRPDAPGR